MVNYQRYNRRSVKLTDAQVVEAIRLYYEEHWSQGRIARKLNCAGVTIGRIVRGESRRSVTEAAPVDSSEADLDPNTPPMSQEQLDEINTKLAAKLTKAPPTEAVPPWDRTGTDDLASLVEGLHKRKAELTSDEPSDPVGGAVPQADIEETRTDDNDQD